MPELVRRLGVDGLERRLQFVPLDLLQDALEARVLLFVVRNNARLPGGDEGTDQKPFAVFVGVSLDGQHRYRLAVERLIRLEHHLDGVDGLPDGVPLRLFERGRGRDCGRGGQCADN